MPEPQDIDDLRWLVSEAARPWLTSAPDRADPLRATKRLRRELDARRARLVVEQFELRTRGINKFSQAESMFFTRLGLEQATEEMIADYKADRFPSNAACFDVCCGIGGDCMALARRTRVVAIDRDPVAALFAQANANIAQAQNSAPVSLRCETADAESLADVEVWHADPDRRTHGRRSISLDEHQPDRQWFTRALQVCGNAAIKLAPAAILPDDWQARAELEWISTRGECRQQVAWFGSLAATPGLRKATTILPSGAASFVGDCTQPMPSEPRLGEFLLEPDSAVLAAGLDAALATELSLWSFTNRAAYLSSDAVVQHPLAACFKIVDTLPLAVRPLKQALAARGIGQLEIKKRGVSVTPESLRKSLALRGDKAATLVLTPLGQRQVALLVERVSSAESP